MTKDSKEWLKKYYPVEATELCEASAKECLEHSLLKWQGLANAKQYNLSIRLSALREESDYPVFWPDGDSCALCKKYYRGSGNCTDCPLAEELGHPCDSDDSGNNLYDRSLRNPQLMVDVLSDILERLTCENTTGEIEMTEKYTVADVLSKGIDHGRSLFEYNIQDVPGYEYVASGTVDEDFDLDEFEDKVRSTCWDADEGYRQYSPFEFFAQALNESENSEDLWEAYDKGIDEGVEDMLAGLVQKYRLSIEDGVKMVDEALGESDEE